MVDIYKWILILILCLFCNIHSKPFEEWPTSKTRDYAHVGISGIANIGMYETLHLIFPEVKSK